jgi:hypothetical protein
MSGTYTFTVTPTPQDVIWGVLQYSYLIAALVCLGGLLFTSKLLEEEPP